MMKKVVIVNILILCFFTVFAQAKIDKETFDKYVDYANCQYLMTFIETKENGKPYITDTYNKSIKTVLLNANLSKLKDIPSFEKIQTLFSNNSNNLALGLAIKINEKKIIFQIT